MVRHRGETQGVVSGGLRVLSLSYA